MQRLLIFGGQGQLGQDLVRVLSSQYDVVTFDVDTCDITDVSAVRRVLHGDSAMTVINCAAMTDVPGCESDDGLAFRINAVGAKHVALVCEEKQIRMVHISTDYVFDGLKREPYVETDAPHPLNVYGLTKLAGEYYVRNLCTRHVVVRSSGLYGIFECQGKRTNFVETMLRLSRERETIRVVDDEILTPTFTLDLARQILVLLKEDASGVFHATNNGSCSWYQFSKRIFEIAAINVRVEKTTSKEFASPVRRPAYSVLQNKALQDRGIDIMKTWDQALADYFLDKDHLLTI